MTHGNRRHSLIVLTGSAKCWAGKAQPASMRDSHVSAGLVLVALPCSGQRRHFLDGFSSQAATLWLEAL
jgi:hypothetical protein